MMQITEQGLSQIQEEVLRLQRPKNFFKRVFSQNNSKLLRLAKLVERQLQEAEASGIFVLEPTSVESIAYKKQLCTTWTTAMAVSQAILTISMSPSVELRMKRGELERLVIGNKYAAGGENGGLDPLREPNSQAFAFLTEIATTWKQQGPLAMSHELDSLERQQLQQAACYPDWVNLLKGNPWLRKPFLHFCLRDFNPVSVFVCYPTTTDRIKKALLSSQLGYARRMDGEVFVVKVQPDGLGRHKKVLTLPVYQGENFSRFQPGLQERVSILDMRDKVHFEAGNLEMTIGEIFHQCGERNTREARINFSAFGFVNFHPHHGVWNATTSKYTTKWTTHPDFAWLHQIPPTRVVAHQELVRRYGSEKMGEREFFYKVMSTRQKNDVTCLKCHAFLQIWLRMPAREEWKVLDIGYYADRFPTGVVDKLSMICGTLPGRVALIDQNGYYSHRQRAEVVCFSEDTEFRALCYKLLQHVTTPRVFQLTGRNCAYSLQKLVQKASGRNTNYFCMPSENAKVGIELLDRVLQFLSRVHRLLRKIASYTLRKLLWENRGISIRKKGRKKWYSLPEFRNKKGDVLFSPPFLHEQILHGRLPGTICFGHTQEQVNEGKKIV